MIRRLAQNQGNVLPLYTSPTEKDYRAAIAKIVRTIKLQFGLTNQDLADMLRCSEKTIANADNENNSLNGATLAMIGYVFGGQYLEPFEDLYLCRHPEPETNDSKFNKLLRGLEELWRDQST